MTLRSVASSTTHLAIAAHSMAIPADGEVPPEWICIMPAGTFTGVDGRGPYTSKDPDAIASASMKLRGLVPLDYNHQTVYAVTHGGEAPAAAWFDKMEVREGAIWGHLADWTPDGKTAVCSKAYRFVSPAFQHTKAGIVTRIESVGLVNNPNLTGLPAIASQIGDPLTMDKTFLQQLALLYGLPADADEAAILAASQKSFATASSIKTLATSLALPADTSAETLVTAFNAKLATATPDPSLYVPMSAFSELQTKVAAMETDRATTAAHAAVTDAMKAGKVSPALKEWATAYASKDLAGFQAWSAAAPAIVAPGGSTTTGTGGAGPDAALTDSDLAVCSVLGISQDEFKKQRTKETAR